MLLASSSRGAVSIWLALALACSLFNASLADEVCASHQFECASTGHCIPFSWACDGEPDCPDGSDEKEHCTGKAICSETEFKCATGGRCILLRWQCDGDSDCEDHSDEDPAICQSKQCTDEQFACKTRPGECVPIAWVCDSNADCSDGTDEEGCNATCTSDEFTCANGRCVQRRWHCDGENDCGDNSDEELCPKAGCPPDTSFDCGDSTCVQSKYRCDGSVDCQNGSDEVNCPPDSRNATSHCLDKEFQCADGINCIHSSWQCDGDHDCPDGSDERDCSPSTCRPDQFRCDDGQCIPGHLQCSGQAECNDTSDEMFCNATTARKGCDAETEFDCGGGLCIEAGKVCDGNNDCGQWEDEPSDRCSVNECSVNNGGCQHACIDTAVGFRCACHHGYKLAGNATCIDIDECEEPGVCSQVCINEKGDFKCECASGYTRDPHDRTRCKANEGHSALLFTHRTDIRRFSLDRRSLTAIVNETRSSTALDFHFESGMLFWSDVNDERIYKAPIDEGENKAVVAHGDVVNADGLAVDWIYHHLYWTDAAKNTIEVSDLDGALRKTLLSDGVQQPRSIAVDPLEGWLYWSDWGASPRIERAGMDGSHRQVLVDSHIKWPNGITLDRVDRRLFWVDGKMNLIASCNYDGSGRRVVLAGKPHVSHPFSVSVFEDWIYWSDWEHHTIKRANKFNGRNATSVTHTHSLLNPMVVHVYHSYRQPDGVNHCSPFNGRCSHLCLPAPQINSASAKFSCACPDGFQLLDDGLNCVEGAARSTETPPAAPHAPKNQTGPRSRESLAAEEGAEAQPTPSPNNSASGTVTALVVGAAVGMVLVVALAGFFVYRHVVLRNATSMNFDNPVYRKTTEDKFALAKNQPPRTYATPTAPTEETLEPLTHPGTNEYV